MAPNAGGGLATLGNFLTGTSKEATPAFSGGIVGRMGAIAKLERRPATSRSVARGDLNLARIAKMNAPASSFIGKTIPGQVGSGISYKGSLGMNLLERNSLTATAHTAKNSVSSLTYGTTGLSTVVRKSSCRRSSYYW